MKQPEVTFFALLRNEICRTGELSTLALTPELRASLVKLAKRQDLAHLLYDVLLRNNLLTEEDPEYPALSKAQMLAIYRTEEQTRELATVQNFLRDAKIPSLALKGAVLRNLYPEPWMRTASDIDLLLPEQEVARAEKLFEERGYTLYFRSPHDVSYTGSTGVHIELHRTLSAKGEESGLYSPILASAWDRLLFDGDEPKMPDDLFYFYHIFHMAVHFKIGGCGVRPLLDLWLINQNFHGDRSAREALLAGEGLLTFANNMERLSDYWFSATPGDDFLESLTEFLLSGGIYGTRKTAAYIKEGERGGKRRYRLTRVFLPFGELKERYPVLEKWPILFPLVSVYRWGKALFGRSAQGVEESLAGGEALEEELGIPSEAFWSRLGL